MEKYLEKVMKMRRWVVIGHHIPGRVRLKYKLGIVAQLMQFNLQNVDDVIAQIPAFRSYKLNKATGCIVIEYDANTLPLELVDDLFGESDQAAERAYFAIAQYLSGEGIQL
ncbi:cation transporter [Shewanella sp. WXL01]|uniref:cation transporter n=1 Tax=Shewanella sp. WXL01 TaxID=2709721 RepID=UPI0014386C71|nr:cation transporter [Shewanella sp. WXL01]NKF49064.1 cation transporter [Shewanella sp. WXL01]